MKRLLILIFAFLCMGKYSFGQESGNDYAFKTDVRVFQWDESKQQYFNDPKTYFRAQRGNIFTLKQHVTFTNAEGKSESGCRIVFWHFNKNNRQNKPSDGQGWTGGVSVVVIDSAQNDKFFYISDEELKNNATTDFIKPKGLVKVDGVVLPVKLRFKNKQGGSFDFGQSISVGPAINFNVNYGGAFSENTVSLLLGANISSISVDEKTVPTVVSSKTTLLGLTPFVGINYAYHGVSFGLMSGIDILSGKAEDNWLYRKSPWLGFTIGTSLISTTKKTNNATGN